MSKKHTFTVTIEFMDKVYSDHEIFEVTENILSALVDRVDRGPGLSPEASETFTTEIEVGNSRINAKCQKTFV